jgi:hypothetical protein
MQYVLQVLALVVIRWEFYKGQHSNGVLCCFWGLWVVVGIIPFRSYILEISYDDEGGVVLDDTWRFILFYLSFALCLIQFILASVSDLKALKPSAPRSKRFDEFSPLLGDQQHEEDRPPDPLSTAVRL